MRKTFLLIGAASFVACAKKEGGVADSSAAAAAAPAPAPAAPAALTAADLVGTWNGQSMAQGSDSVIARWTCVQPATGNESKCVDAAAPKDTSVYTYTISGDSVMFTSAAYTPPAPPKSPKVIDHVVGRKAEDKWMGTSVTTLASKPDSVVMRTRWEATKSP
jgi:hypothetical protein